MKKFFLFGLVCILCMQVSAGNIVTDLLYSATNVVVGAACVVGNVVSGAVAGVTGSDQVMIDYVQEPLYNRNVYPDLYRGNTQIVNETTVVNNTYNIVVARGCRPPYRCGSHYLINNRYIPAEQVNIIYE